MLKSRCRDKAQVPAEPVELREGASVVLQVVAAPPIGVLGFLTVTNVRAVYERGEFILRRPPEVRAGSVEDHIHMAVSVPPSIALSEFVRHVKGSSSHFMNYELAVPIPLSGKATMA